MPVEVVTKWTNQCKTRGIGLITPYLQDKYLIAHEISPLENQSSYLMKVNYLLTEWIRGKTRSREVSCPAFLSLTNKTKKIANQAKNLSFFAQKIEFEPFFRRFILTYKRRESYTQSANTSIALFFTSVGTTRDQGICRDAASKCLKQVGI